MKTVDFDQLRRFSADIRIQTVKAIGDFGYGHIGGSVSFADLMAVLYGEVMNVDPKDPKKEDRDWFILSKGHCAPGLYATLALKGFFPMEWLSTINQGGTNLPSHADTRKVPGVDISTGSLGQGISAAVGIAAANKYLGRDSYTYCLIGDGESNEGQVWEALESANKFELDHLYIFVDWNKKQLDGTLEEIMPPVDLAKKFEAFGLDTRVCRGDDVEAIYKAIMAAREVKGKAHCIVLDTWKGLGISFAEKEAFNHYMTFGPDKAREAADEIEKRLANGTYPGGDVKW